MSIEDNKDLQKAYFGADEPTKFGASDNHRTAREEISEEYSDMYYWLYVHCGNCGKRGSYAFSKGVASIAHACPNCGVKYLVKDL